MGDVTDCLYDMISAAHGSKSIQSASHGQNERCRGGVIVRSNLIASLLS